MSITREFVIPISPNTAYVIRRLERPSDRAEAANDYQVIKRVTRPGGFTFEGRVNMQTGELFMSVEPNQREDRVQRASLERPLGRDLDLSERVRTVYYQLCNAE